MSFKVFLLLFNVKMDQIWPGLKTILFANYVQNIEYVGDRAMIGLEQFATEQIK